LDRAWNLFEPMRRSGRNDDDITFCKVMNLAALDIASKPLVRPALFPANHRSAGDERRLTVHDVEDIGLFLMHLDLTSHIARKNANGVFRCSNQRSAFCDFVVVRVRCWCGFSRSSKQNRTDE